MRRFRKRTASHSLHLGLTVATLGVWGVVWLIAALRQTRRHWRCAYCGSSARKGSVLVDYSVPYECVPDTAPPAANSDATAREAELV